MAAQGEAGVRSRGRFAPTSPAARYYLSKSLPPSHTLLASGSASLRLILTGPIIVKRFAMVAVEYSAIWSIPSYQTGVASQAVNAAMVSTTMRNVPDVVLARQRTGVCCLPSTVLGQEPPVPVFRHQVWASFISLVNQGLGQNAPLGFANPALYRIAQSSKYSDDFHDITISNNGYYPAEPGFDDATGLGSFNGLNLYNDLVANSIPATDGHRRQQGRCCSRNAQVALSWSVSSGDLLYDVKRSTVSGGPSATIASSIVYAAYAGPMTQYTNGTTYYYVVSAVNHQRIEFLKFCASLSATPLRPVPPQFPAPVGWQRTARVMLRCRCLGAPAQGYFL